MAFSKATRALTVFMVFTTAVANCCQDQKPMMSSATPANLQVHIEPALEDSTLKVTVSNTHESSPLTILTWDAPFDRLSRDSGTYHIQPTKPGSEELESLGIKIKRMLPAPRDALVEIPAKGKIERELQLKSKWIPTDGERYKVWAKGPWRAVWAKKLDHVTDDDLKSIVGEFDIDSKYETNVAEIVLK